MTYINNSTNSEQQYLTILNSLNDPMHVVDRDLRIMYQNPAMINWLTKLKIDSEIIGKTIFEVFPFLDYDKVYNEYDKIFQNGGVLVTTEATKPFDRFLYTETSKIPIKTEGKVNQVITILRDITDQKEAEEKLVASEKKFRNLFENSPNMIILLNKEGIILDVNQLFLKRFGYEKEELIGKNFQNVSRFDSENILLLIKKHKEVIEKGKVEPFILETKTKEGVSLWFNFQASTIEIGEQKYIQVIFQDITEKVSADRELKESEEKFRSITEQSIMSILVIQDGLIKYINERVSQINGYSEEEILNWGPYEFMKVVHPEDKDFILEQAKKKQSGDPDVTPQHQYRLIRKDNEIRWIENFSKTINFDGKPADLVTTIDITDKIKAEQKLKESEEKYRYLIENALEGVWVIDSNADTILVNPTMAKILGYTVDEMIGKSLFSFIDEDQIEITKKQIKRRKLGIADERDAEYLHKNGNKVYLRLRAAPIFDKQRNYEGAYAFLADITQQKLAEQKLKESEENFRTIAEQAFIGTLIIQDDKVEYVNEALLQIFDFSHEDVHNWTKDDLLKLIFPEDLDNLREYRNKLKAGEPDFKKFYSFRAFTKYGKLKWIDQFSKSIIYRGKPAELITIMDITEKKKAEQELIKLNNLKSELLRRTSHELKTPLVSIKGFSDLLLTVHKEKLDDYVLATVREIKLGCERLENLIQDILKTSELETESVEIKKRKEDLSFLIKLCIKELQGLIRLRNHEISLEIHDKLITWFEPDQIHLVISNLLSNAIKYTPPDGKIIIQSALTQDYILISIKDNGIGITTEEKKRLFSQFGKIERYGQGLDLITEGSGLGLYITKKIIELHGGMIRVKSGGRNKGSTFYFTLPLIEKKD
ncbi:MAG: PAS domain S-box protein [Promethearchaeota archaeon]